MGHLKSSFSFCKTNALELITVLVPWALVGVVLFALYAKACLFLFEGTDAENLFTLFKGFLGLVLFVLLSAGFIGVWTSLLLTALNNLKNGCSSKLAILNSLPQLHFKIFDKALVSLVTLAPSLLLSLTSIPILLIYFVQSFIFVFLLIVLLNISVKGMSKRDASAETLGFISSNLVDALVFGIFGGILGTVMYYSPIIGLIIYLPLSYIYAVTVFSEKQLEIEA